MSWRWVSIAAFLAALVIGFGLLTGGSSDKDDMNTMAEQPAYYLKDAIITQTTETGEPSMRLVANRIEQQTQDNSIVLHNVRLDYQKVPDKQWVLSAQRGVVPAESRVITFQGDVRLRPLDGPPSTVLETDEMSIDTDRNIAYTTRSPVSVRFGNYTMDVKRFEANLETEKVKVESVRGTAHAG